MSKTGAKCRGCGRDLQGRDYAFGSVAHIPETAERAKINHYGGFVCSPRCDYKASLDLEQTMPGHNAQQTKIGCFAQESYNRNWGNLE